ncbi:MAG: signal peptidase II [Hyphomicrobiaceae bacterium]
MIDEARHSRLSGALTRFGLLLAAIVIVCDQANKWWLLQVYRIEDKGRIELTPFLDLIYVKNTGISYGMFSLDNAQGQYLLAGVAVVVSLGMFVWLTRTGSYLIAVSLGLIIGGALGNAVDRLSLGGVADFYSFHVFGYYWYIFNLADVAIVAGAAGLLYDSLVASRKKAQKEG